MTVREWTEYWQENINRPNVRPSTFAAHGYVLKNHILPILGEYELTDLTEQDIRRFLGDRRANGNHRQAIPLSQQTMRHICTLLSNILNHAVDAGYIKSNPAASFRYSVKKQVCAQVMSKYEVMDYLDAAWELGYLPMFTLALEYGLRQRELIALKWSDLNIETGVLTIQTSRVVERRELVSYGRETRQIQLSEEAAEQLKLEHRKHPSSEVMFIHPGTLKPYSPAMVRLLHQRILEQAGLDHIPFKDLRHTYAVLAMEKGCTLKELAANLGHTRVRTTRRNYREYLPEGERKWATGAICDADMDDQKDAADMLASLLPL